MLKHLSPIERALFAALVLVWVVWTGTHAWAAAQGRLAWLDLKARVIAPATPDDFPRIGDFLDDGRWLGWALSSGLRPGDRLVRIGDADLRGVGPAGFLARASEQAEADRGVRVVVERAGERREGEWVLDGLDPGRWWWRLPGHIAWGALAVILLVRARGSRAAHALGWATLFGAIYMQPIVGVDHRLTLVCLAAVGVAGALVLPLMLRALLLFPDEAAPSRRGPLLACWVFAPVAPAGAYAFAVGRATLFQFDQAVAAGALAFCTCALALLVRSWVRSTGAGRRQIKWVIWGWSVPLSIAAVVYAVSLWDPYLRWARDWLGFVGIVTPLGYLIALQRFDLFDVDRVWTASLSFGAAGAALLGLGLWAVPHLADVLGASAGISPGAVQPVLAIAIAALVVPLQRTLKPPLERVLFPERHALEAGVRGVLREVASAEKLEEIAGSVGRALTTLLRPDCCAIYARTGEGFEPIFAHGRAVPPAFDVRGALASALREHRGAVLYERPRGAKDDVGGSPFERAALATLGTRAIVPFRRGGDLVGFLCLGTKGSGDIYTATDVTLLGALGEGVSSALDRIAERELLERARDMQQRLRRFVPGAIAEEVEADRELEEREAEVSVLFVDLRAYATWAESRESHEIFSTVNRYTEAVTSVVRGLGGTVVEFNGDGMMAVFGAPRPHPAKARAAVEAGRAILEAVGALAPTAGGDGPAAFGVGVGIATGAAFVGEIRAADRRIWSAIGNTTNLAARLQALTRELGARLVIDASTWAEAGTVAAYFERVDDVAIRGRARRETVYVRR